MSRCRIITADVLQWAAEYDAEPFSALLCDPPYHLHQDKRGVYRLDGMGANERGKPRGGFMNCRWDGGDIAFQPETWAALGKHLHPGAFIMAFAGSRGWHRQAVAMEDAGLIMHPTLFRLWTYGSGFPKSTRIKGDPVFAGHRYGLQALKPAVEPVLCFQVPYAGRPVDSITATGAGALNIEGARIGTNGESPRGSGLPCPNGRADILTRALGKDGPNITPAAGRWPPNLCLDEAAAAALDAQSGVSVSTGGRTVIRSGHYVEGKVSAPGTYTDDDPGFGDAGGASRFFHVSDWQAEQIEQADPMFYTAKAGRRERDAGLEEMSTAERQLAISQWEGQTNGSGKVMGPSMPARNGHPTIKPLRLTRWLATLLLPPAAYAPRRILVPFAGSGSEAIGAELAGWDEVLGIELSDEYAEIARARAKFWSGNVGLFDSLTAAADEEDAQAAMEF